MNDTLNLQQIKDDQYNKLFPSRYTAFLQIQLKLVSLLEAKVKSCNKGQMNRFKEADLELVYQVKTVLEFSEELIRKQQEEIKALLSNRREWMEQTVFLQDYNKRLLTDNYNYQQEKEIHQLNQIATKITSKPLLSALQKLKELTITQYQLSQQNMK